LITVRPSIENILVMESLGMGIWQLLAVVLKSSLMWGYHSTDFEVHRNWMAITYNEPLSRWYYNDLSIWTLDYPPFFAYFEWCLAQIAVRVDPEIVRLSAGGVLNEKVVYFQRCSVLFSEYLLELAAMACMTHFSRFKDFKRREAVHLLLILNGGLIMVDHMHFQYNGMLMGILVLTFDACFRKRYLTVALIFSCLVLSKHLFMTLAPVYALFLWRFYCMEGSHSYDIRVLGRFGVLVLVALVTIGVCFGPVLLDGLDNDLASKLPDIVKERFLQILSRLFPFGRGLVHSYWAPNVWAVYYFLDRFAYAALKRLALSGGFAADAATKLLPVDSVSTVSGLVGGVAPAVFKDISAPVCMVLVLAFMTPALFRIMTAPLSNKASDSESRTSLLIKCVVHASLTAFLFGYHVHEKAILVPLVVQTFLLGGDKDSKGDGDRVAFNLYFELAVAGVAGLFPLFTTDTERYKKVLIFVGYLWLCNRVRHGHSFSLWNKFMLLVTLGVVAFTEFLYPYAATQDLAPALASFCRKFEFVPLMTMSVSGAIFLIHAWFTSLEQLRA
jgi:alpha-1,3-glucosyltransferase